MTKRLKATHTGPLKIGDISIPCAVLEDGTRVLSEHGITTALRSRSGASKRLKKHATDGDRAPLPVFVAPDSLKPFISDELKDGPLNPIEYEVGKHVRRGFRAEVLPQVCEVWLKARDAGVVQKQQMKKCRQAEILMRGIAHIGIISLVDEATGYQYVRDREELQKILAAYIRPELMPWTRRFPDDFYKEMFRLWGWKYPPDSRKGAPRGPRYAGKLTRQLVYEKLPSGVIDELERRNPSDDKGQRSKRHHQWLTDDIGNPHLGKQVAVATTLMRISLNKAQFKRNFARAFPEGHQQAEMFDESDSGAIDV